MKTIWAKLLMLAAAMAFTLTVHAQQHASADEAVAMVKKGVAYVKAHGQEKAFTAFNDPKGAFVKGELYLFVFRTNGDGINLAHGQKANLIGKPLIDMRDDDGVFIIKESTKVANSPEGKGWVKYNWPNTVTGKPEAKKSYIERVGDIWIGCGVYQ